MDIKLNQKIIKEMCGTVSFKRGEAYCRSNKVSFSREDDDVCEATVTGSEDFYVTIKKAERGRIEAHCSCPKLASFQKDCQHIAAVLLALYEKQKNNRSSQNLDSKISINHELSEGLLTLFKPNPKPSSGSQSHFEKRKVLEIGFTIKHFETDKEGLGIRIEMDSTKVPDIRSFFESMKFAQPYQVSEALTYNPMQHCFQQEADDVLQLLLQMIEDEKLYHNTFTTGEVDHEQFKQWLLISPSAWEKLQPALEKNSNVKLEYAGTYHGFDISIAPLPLQFTFTKDAEKGFQLRISGLNEMAVLEPYQTVLSQGKIIPLKREECQRLTDIKSMIQNAGSNTIPIPREQVSFFLEKVMPGLKTLGDVQISQQLANRMLKIPLQAKLYLDRVNNRLLAGLEFQYENIVFNPLETQKQQINPLLIRDLEKEEMILNLMEESSFAVTDSGYYLHNEELEYDFLMNTVPKLEKFVGVYATTAVRSRIIRGGVGPRIRIKVKKERMNWLEFKFELDDIPQNQIKEVLQAIEEKRKYYRLRNGSLLSLETREIQQLQRFLLEIPVDIEEIEQELNIPIAKGMQILDILEDHRDVLTIEESFQQFLEEIYNPDKLKFEVPSDLESILHDYQKHGFRWMKTLAHYGFGGILADDMGLGKTLQSITFISSVVKEIRERKQPVLIVCPTSLTYNWESEFLKFTPELQAIVIDGNKRDRELLQKELNGIDVVITSYPLLRADIKWYEKQTFHTVFFDEAQAFKNPITQTAKAVQKVKADHSFALTGTPIENSLEELWSIFHVVFPGLFGTLRDFSSLRKQAISRRIRPFLLRRKKADVLSELPEKIEEIQLVQLLPDQKKLYAAYLAKLRHETLKHLDKETFRKNRIKILAGLTRLRQICCHPALFVEGYEGRSAKFESLLQLVEEANTSGRRVLIFSQFTKMLGLIGRELTKRGISFFYLDGQTPSEDRVDYL